MYWYGDTCNCIQYYVAGIFIACVLYNTFQNQTQITYSRWFNPPPPKQKILGTLLLSFNLTRYYVGIVTSSAEASPLNQYEPTRK
jgi:hypothetical protein